MRVLLIILLALFFIPPAFAQPSTWYAVIVTSVAIEGRTMSIIIGPYPSSAMCTSQLSANRASIQTPELPVQSATCRSNIDVARMMLSP